jgi:protease-4
MKRKFVLTGILIVIMLVLCTMPLGCAGIGNKVVVISLSGPIQADGSGFLFGSNIISPKLVRSQLERAKNDTSVKAVVIRVESPGGSAAASQEILDEIEQVGKPVVVSFGDMAASGGYYISAKADKIVALPGTLTGSIGVIFAMPNLKGLYEKLGIEMEVITAGEHKDMFAGVRELTPEEEVIMQEMTDQLYDEFVQVVAEGRKLSEDKVRELATGQLYTGVQAKELGLVDELGGLSKAIDVAANLAGIEKPQVEYYKKEVPSLLSALLEMSVQRLQTIIQVQSLGAEGVLLLKTLNNPYPQPEYR